MCNNCNCENYHQCSIVGYMPVGFCCTKCYLYDEQRTCLNAQLKRAEKQGENIKPIETKIEAGVLKVVIEKDGKRVPLVIDLKQQFREK